MVLIKFYISVRNEVKLTNKKVSCNRFSGSAGTCCLYARQVPETENLSERMIAFCSCMIASAIIGFSSL